MKFKFIIISLTIIYQRIFVTSFIIIVIIRGEKTSWFSATILLNFTRFSHQQTAGGGAATGGNNGGAELVSWIIVQLDFHLVLQNH